MNQTDWTSRVNGWVEWMKERRNDLILQMSLKGDVWPLKIIFFLFRHPHTHRTHHAHLEHGRCLPLFRYDCVMNWMCLKKWSQTAMKTDMWRNVCDMTFPSLHKNGLNSAMMVVTHCQRQTWRKNELFSRMTCSHVQVFVHFRLESYNSPLKHQNIFVWPKYHSFGLP